MAIKFVSENSNINVTTFAEAPETAELDIQFKQGTTVNAETMFKITSVDSIYTQLGIPADTITNEQLVALLDRIIELQATGKQQVDQPSLLEWANRSAIFATIASAEPLVATVSAVVALASYGKEGIAKVKGLLRN